MNILNKLFKKKSIEYIKNEMKNENLERTIGLFDLIMIGIGGTVGSGVFATAGFIAKVYAGPAAILSWFIAGLGCILNGVSFMELATTIPSHGSTYAYAYYALGELPAVIAGFLLTLEYGVSSSGIARSWSDKFIVWLHDIGIEGPSWMKSKTHSIDLYAGILQLLCVLIVLKGKSTGKKFINAITVTKISVVLFIIIFGFIHIKKENFIPFIPDKKENNTGQIVYGWPGIILGASASFFGYIGYDEVCCLAGEAKNPSYTIPRAVIGTVAGAAILSTLATFSLVGIQKYSDIDLDSSYGIAFKNVGANWAKNVVETGEVLTMPVGVLISFLAQPRVQYAMAKDGLLPSIFMKVDQNGNLFWGSFISGIILIMITIFIKFEILWDFISLGIILAFNLTNICLLLIRCRNKDNDNNIKNINNNIKDINNNDNNKNDIIWSSEIIIFNYIWISFLTAFLWQKGVISYHYQINESIIYYYGYIILAILFSFATLALTLLLNNMITENIIKRKKRIKSDIDFNENKINNIIEKDIVDHIFYAPYVPFTPCIAILFNWFLFAQMHWSAILMIFIWILFAIFCYFSYGYFYSHHSCSINNDLINKDKNYEKIPKKSPKSDISKV